MHLCMYLSTITHILLTVSILDLYTVLKGTIGATSYRRQGCGSCKQCLCTVNCGVCKYCKNITRFGGATP